MKRLSCVFLVIWLACSAQAHEFNGGYCGEYLNRIAFPLGGIGAGMIALEGTGAISHVSLRHHPDIFNEPFTFAAVCVKGIPNGAKVLEGPVPDWKVFGRPNAGNGGGNAPYGLPRFAEAEFLARFPFAEISLHDNDLPLQVTVCGWSPFIPSDEDNSSLPVAALEYTFRNTSSRTIEAVFSFHSRNLMRIPIPSEWGGTFEPGDAILPFANGFILHQDALEGKPHAQGDFVVFVQDDRAVIDHCWFRGGWFDPLTITWKTVMRGETREQPPIDGSAPGASLYVPFSLVPNESKTIRLLAAWYVPFSDLRAGSQGRDTESPAYRPWYASRFYSVAQVAEFWRDNYSELRRRSALFRDAFYGSTLPAEVLEAVAANLTILKSPTVLRQFDGRLWAWEGCHDLGGCCYGSCTHVWNYAQAIAHLFPNLERTLRETEFFVSQNNEGHQTFRANLPISTPEHNFYAAADGQLGGIIKVYREWRISGDIDWLRKLWPQVRTSLEYCIRTWDPRRRGVIEEPHHNTYDIEFWGPEPLGTTFYLGALRAATLMAQALGESFREYERLYQRGRKVLESELFNGEYFFQKVVWQGLQAKSPVEMAKETWTVDYSPEALDLLQKEGPKYQYGVGCLSDGVLGCQIALMAGLGEIIDQNKVKSHLKSVFRYNFKPDLSDHVNPQRPTYALGKEGGLVLCTWPKGGEPTLPFVYSNEVWTGIEYQVAAHLIAEGMIAEGLQIVRTCRQRYDGRVRNPFNEYECGHWYGRALSSYGLLYACSGVRYDAVNKTLYFRSTKRDFVSFFAAAGGFGQVGVQNGKPFYRISEGDLPVRHIVIEDEAK
ncbi:MAG: non-lysosomal glucosylceramidase [candidate division KSB1 bacterium]|nr:non-lysosomal glucosylceramidase [candidate division KSB1 bacterium]MDZ7345256.1 non-lysosomal glucosylceramidase [candidate division KSB1 bacterium]